MEFMPPVDFGMLMVVTIRIKCQIICFLKLCW